MKEVFLVTQKNLNKGLLTKFLILKETIHFKKVDVMVVIWNSMLEMR